MREDMKAAILTEVGKLIVADTDMPLCGREEVLIRVKLGGICGSDHTLYHGRFGVHLPVIPGHEAVGVIEATGEGVIGLEVGQRVTIQPNFSCGRCALCTAGHGNTCPSKIRLGVDTNGVFAEFVKVPARYVWKVPEALPDEVAVFTEPLSVGVHAMRITSPNPGDKVLIFGAGIMGLLVLQLAVSKGARVTACDLAEKRLSLAKQLGAEDVIGPNASHEDFINTFDVIYETSGVPMALDRVIRLAAPLGRIVVLSLPGKDHSIPIDMVVRKELTIRGSLIYTDEFPEALQILQSGKVKTTPLATGKITLPELDQVLGVFASPERIKTLVEI
jgi:2-desacetyl-2-hydroxyethyl bacteriochlorophyllide A dehydrogenase